MILFNNTIISFNQRCLRLLKVIVEQAGFPVRRTRFEYHGYFYPLKVVSFEGSEIGRFNSNYWQIEMNRGLIPEANDAVLMEILKHEFAHYITTIDFPKASAHGKEFHQVCKQLGFKEEISAATMDLKKTFQKIELKDKKHLLKVKKLFQLGDSDNVFEAEAATIKANQILLKYNLQNIQTDDEIFELKQLIPQKRKNAKLLAVYDILKHFSVSPVISMGNNTCSIEIVGTPGTVKLCTYVAEFLDKELDRLWVNAKTDSSFKGLKAKNSFFRGIALGYEEKMQEIRSQFTKEEKKGLVALNHKLQLWTDRIYGRLSRSSSMQKSDQKAERYGRTKGHLLNVRSGVDSPKTSGRFLVGGKF